MEGLTALLLDVLDVALGEPEKKHVKSGAEGPLETTQFGLIIPHLPRVDREPHHSKPNMATIGHRKKTFFSIHGTNISLYKPGFMNILVDWFS